MRGMRDASKVFERVLVLGATGMIGAHALRAALRRGLRARVLVRPASDRRLLEGLAVETTEGDLADLASLERALAGCDLVLHAAAPYPKRHFGKGRLLAGARRGMENLLRAAGGARRVVYVSSSTTIGLPEEPRPARESDTRRIRDSAPYFALKFMLEDLARDAAAGGLPLVVVNPTFCVDEFDDHRTTAQLMVPLAQRRIPAYLAGTLNAVATRDVGEGILLAAERGRVGERYILGGENLTSREFLARCARAAGVPAPRRALPFALAEPISFATEVVACLTGTPPLFPMTGIRMMRHGQAFDLTRAREELGYAPTPLDDAIARAYAWYRARGWVG
jgi:dihydroflavonol-4-reductase